MLCPISGTDLKTKKNSDENSICRNNHLLAEEEEISLPRVHLQFVTNYLSVLAHSSLEIDRWTLLHYCLEIDRSTTVMIYY